MATIGDNPDHFSDMEILTDIKDRSCFWQKRTKMEIVLLVVSLILGIVVVILAALVASHQQKVSTTVGTDLGSTKSGFTDASTVLSSIDSNNCSTTVGTDLCTTKACITVASTVLNSIDSSTDPCDDFYQYACGGWIDKHPIPGSRSNFDKVWYQNFLVLKKELEKSLNESKSQAERKARLYYQSCMDENKTVEKLGAQPLIDLLRDLGLGNIRCPNCNQESWDFTGLLKKLHAFGWNIFFSSFINIDKKDSNKNILQLDQSELKHRYMNKTIKDNKFFQDGLLLARDMYLNEEVKYKIYNAYVKYIMDIGELLGGDYYETEQFKTDVIGFRRAFVKILTPEKDRQEDMQSYHRITLEEMNTLAPFMDWVDYFNTLLKVTNVNVTANENILVFAPTFLQKLSTLIIEKKSTANGRRMLNSYMVWKVAVTMLDYLSSPFREALRKFYEVYRGIDIGEKDWPVCALDTDKTIGFASGAMFVRAAFKGNSKPEAELMIQEIKDAFKKNLPRLKWMDDETREAAIDKANAISDMIGFPDYILNATEIDKHYGQLEINSEEYFMNKLRYFKYKKRRNLEELRQSPNKKRWVMTPIAVNAYYQPTRNDIAFPAGILQAPFYSHDYPKSLNFGGIGFVMGHELTHGFDDRGREYDKHGNLRLWWNNATVDRFIERTKCMVDQYSKFSINGEHVRGNQTLGENIADNGGLKSAYNAYVHYTKVHGEEDSLPGVSLTHRQLFFVAFAKNWCSNNKPQAEQEKIRDDTHSPDKVRVWGSIMNSREFAENFKCPAGKKMNPVDKCEVW